MKAEALQMPSKLYEINIIGEEAEITLIENIAEEAETAESPRKWTWDEYRLRVKPRQNLANSIKSGFAIWLEAAKAAERDTAAKAIRKRRNALIAETDYLMTSDYPISESEREAVSEYRQKLRDIPEQRGFPFEVVFPEKPEV